MNHTFTDINTSNRDDIVIDSGATSNYFCRPDVFTHLHPIAPRRVTVGNGDSFIVKRAGHVRLQIFDSENKCNYVSVYALYCPQLNGNFLSTSQLDNIGISTVTKDGVMRLLKNDIEVGLANRANNLYYLSFKFTKHTPNDHLNIVLDPYTLHRQLGHCSASKLRRTLAATRGVTLRGRIPPQFYCAACDLTKTRRHPVIRGIPDDIKRSNPNRIHSDVKTLETSIRGYNYYIVLVHEGSRHTTLIPLKTKDEAADEIKRYFQDFIDRGAHDLELRSDRGRIHR